MRASMKGQMGIPMGSVGIVMAGKANRRQVIVVQLVGFLAQTRSGTPLTGTAGWHLSGVVAVLQSLRCPNLWTCMS